MIFNDLDIISLTLSSDGFITACNPSNIDGIIPLITGDVTGKHYINNFLPPFGFVIKQGITSVRNTKKPFKSNIISSCNNQIRLLSLTIDLPENNFNNLIDIKLTVELYNKEFEKYNDKIVLSDYYFVYNDNYEVISISDALKKDFDKNTLDIISSFFLQKNKTDTLNTIVDYPITGVINLNIGSFVFQPVPFKNFKFISLHFLGPNKTDIPINNNGIGSFTEAKNTSSNQDLNSNLYYALFNKNPVPMVLVNPIDFLILEVNDALIELYGFTRDELLGSNIYSVVFGNKSFSFNNLSDLIGKSIHVKKDKSLIDVIVKSSEFFIDTKNVLLLAINDISESIKSDISLDEINLRLGLLISNLNSVVYRCLNDNFWTMKFISKSVKALTGYLDEDFIDNLNFAFSDLIHPEDKMYVNIVFENTPNFSSQFNLTYRIITKNEEIKWVQEHGKYILSNEGEILFIEGVIIDVTEQKKIELALINNEKKFRVLIEKSPLPILIQNNEKIKYVNDAFLKLFEFDCFDSLKEVNFLDLILKEYKQNVAHKFSLLYNNNSPIEPFELEIFNANGQNKEVIIQALPIQYEGELSSYSLFIDLSKQKKTENDLLKAESVAQTLFDYTSIIIWDEDFSEVKKEIEALKEKGVKDLNVFLSGNKKALFNLVSKILVKAVNKKSLEFYDVQTMDELLLHIPDWFIDESWDVIKDEIVSFSNGNLSFQGEIPVMTPKKELKYLYVNAIIPPEYIHTWEKVLVTFVDVTEQHNTMEELVRQNDKLKEIAWIHSHKVRAPIASFQGLYSLLDFDDLKNESNYEVIINMLQVIQNLDSITQEIVHTTN